MRTKEPKYYPPDYSLVSRLSIQRDFRNASFKRPFGPEHRKEQERPQPESNVKRIISMDDHCEYKQYRRFFVGKLVRIIEKANSGGNWVSFVNEKDKTILNNAAGFSENKCRYLLYGVKYD